MKDSSRDEWFTGLIRRHQVEVWRYLRYLGCDGTRAEDLVQETFLAVWRRPFEDRGEGAARAYLLRAARNRFLMSRRKEKNAPALLDLEAAELVWEEQAPDGGDAYQEALRACLETVGEKARTALELRYRERESRAGIARVLQMSVEGVKTLMRRTRQSLRNCVERRLAT